MLNCQKLLWTIVVSVFLMLGCVPVASTAASLDSPFQVQVNREISLKSEKLNILFVRVEQDSRCLQDTTCVWAGQATILIKVSMDGQNLGDFTLSLSPGQDASVKIDERYSIKLVDLHPYPRKNQVVEGTNYQATLLVSPLR